jgi:hypothetical protein
MAETTNARSHPARMDFEVRVRRLRVSRLRRCGQKQSRVTRTSRTMVVGMVLRVCCGGFGVV